MSRTTALAAFLVLLGTSMPVSAGWWNDNPIRFVSWQDAEQLEKPTYDELASQLELAEQELALLRQELGTAQAESRMDDDAERELRELRDATGFQLTDRELRTSYNYEPDGLDTPGPGGDMGDVATQSQNPVGGLWMMWLQNDMKLIEGPLGGKRIFNTVVFQPVLPVQQTDTWKVINRPVFMFNAFETPSNFTFLPGGGQNPVIPPDDPFSTQAGLGDTAFIQWLSNSPSSSRMVTGYGWNWMFPTATFPDLGTGRTSLGPSVVAMYLGDNVITGGIMQQYFSIDNRLDRPRVSLMDLQYVFRYRLNPMFSIGFAPNIQWDQVTEKVTVPVGFGFDTMTMTKSGMPIRWGAELQYYASHESPTRPFDPEWNFRLYISPFIQAPEWATRGLFGSGSGHCRRCGRHCRCH